MSRALALVVLAALVLLSGIGAAGIAPSSIIARGECDNNSAPVEGDPSMPRPLRERNDGSIYTNAGKWYAKITIAPKRRATVALSTCVDEKSADARRVLLSGLVAKLRAAGVDPDVIKRLVVDAGAAEPGKRLDRLVEQVEQVHRGKKTLEPSKAKAKDKAAAPTFEDVGKLWTSGELAREYPDHVKVKRSGERDRQRLEAYVYPLVGAVPIADFTLDHAETIMRALPPKRVRTPATRRHVAQIIHRVLSLAVFPLRLRTANPLPRGFMPKLNKAKGKAKGWLWPAEDARLLASPAVPLPWRVLYGFLDREGARLSEAASLNVADLDRGTVKLDENKTDDPRAWVLSPGVEPALRAWLAYREKSKGAPLARSAPLFIDEAGERVTGEGIDLSKKFRAHLTAAGIDREDLFERTASREHIRLHDLRATFITISLANGRSESWVADRTGHRSSTMINTYRRTARMAEELGLGELRRLDAAIPELGAETGDEVSDASDEEPPGEVSRSSVYEDASDSTSRGSGAWIRTMIRGFKVSSHRAARVERLRTSANHGANGDSTQRDARALDTWKAIKDTWIATSKNDGAP